MLLSLLFFCCGWKPLTFRRLYCPYRRCPVPEYQPKKRGTHICDRATKKKHCHSAHSFISFRSHSIPFTIYLNYHQQKKNSFAQQTVDSNRNLFVKCINTALFSGFNLRLSCVLRWDVLILCVRPIGCGTHLVFVSIFCFSFLFLSSQFQEN